LVGLHAEGGFPAAFRGGARGFAPAGLEKISVAEINVRRMQLVLASGIGAGTGEIQVRDIEKMSLLFDSGGLKLLLVDIGFATAKDISWLKVR
jgi:hypothetical protein